MKASSIERLQIRIVRNSAIFLPTQCRLWTARLNNQGYPVMTVWIPGRGRAKLFAHRVSLEIFVEPPEHDCMEAAHDPVLCPFKHCVEPAHLRWATRTENEADKRHPSRLMLREVPLPVHVLERECA